MSESRQSEDHQLIKKKFTSSEIDSSLSEDQEDVKVNFLYRLWYAIKGYALEDVQRLYKASVNNYEAKATMPHYENKKIDAEASEKYMNAELTKQKAIEKKLENEQKRIELEKERLEIQSKEAEIMEKKVHTFERLKGAINTIKAKNGEVLFDKKQIQKLLSGFGEDVGVEKEELTEE